MAATSIVPPAGVVTPVVVSMTWGQAEGLGRGVIEYSQSTDAETIDLLCACV